MSKSATGGAAPASAGGGQPTAPGQQTPPGQPAPPPPAPAAGGHTPPLHSVSSTAPLIPGVEGEIPEGVDDDLDVLKGRRQIGYAIGCLGILGIIATLAVSLWSLHVLAEPTKEFEVFAYVKMGAHAVLTVAAVWFCYQMLRAAERMVLPYWWVRYNTDAVRVMLGIRDPWRSAMRAGEQMVELGSKAAQQAVGIVGAVTGTPVPHSKGKNNVPHI
jgi:hypothetical protein